MLVTKFRYAHDATPQHDTFKTPGHASPNPSNFGDTWKDRSTCNHSGPGATTGPVCHIRYARWQGGEGGREGKQKTDKAPNNFFFPSRASVALARSSHIVVLIERITHTLALYPSLGVQKWSTGQATSTLVNRNKTKQNKAKQNHPTKHTNQTKPKQTKQTKQQTKHFFCSNALIALARSLCKCLLAVLIIASGANTVKGYLVRCARIDDTIP